jgi:uncharacterized protein (TIGR02996 family)
MTDGYALLRAIEANPAEDTPRLVYADWLDENAASDSDRARAEFIRVQCELARTPPGERAAELAVQEYTLLNQHRREWEAAYPFRLPRNYSYGRGFLYPNLDGADFAKFGEALAALIPLNYVRLRKVNRAMEAVAACPALRYVRDLSFDTSELRNHHLPVLLDSPYLTNIRVLSLGNNSIGSAGCESLAATTALPALRVLALHGNTAIKDRGLEALTGALWFANLVGLYLSNCGISPAGVIRLAGLPAVSQLRSLDIGDLNRDDRTARAILDSPHLTKLARLWHPDRDLSEPVLAALQARFGANLNLMSYQLDWTDGSSA